MYLEGEMQCVSFHWTKILGDTQGGAILHDNDEADAWFRKARFDGRTEGVAPKDDQFDMIGYHCYISPDVSARLLAKLSVLPKHNADLPNDEYPDLSKFEVFK
jgi:dTDP-4-amino-4,6-dideoxygalactose transaminase